MKYLEMTINPSGNSMEEIDVTGSINLVELEEIKVKIKLAEECLMPVISYGLEV